ncbi:hypothetical protein RSal33209_0454 [Renibacterium salmoninarum ATCC 33209]|uniref:Uncharacterized protein n=1 Tax=Renibacterium salmoninarum (strain ATCC 33209 / DSM 20767 / JCM 11484 / NBRC 15589 / NCIMB 2235) TaxID=288705 RepID=A9WM73_RENSM|nr:hypothetical protein RSal33209_0454 [Renibacterium salmoninarum ATCC 33209]
MPIITPFKQSLRASEAIFEIQIAITLSVTRRFRRKIYPLLDD